VFLDGLAATGGHCTVIAQFFYFIFITGLFILWSRCNWPFNITTQLATVSF